MNNRDKEDSLTLQILEAVDAESDLTQRNLATRTGIALGLANSYLKRCVRKGLLKIHQAPANRYLYYLTPKGFAEKSRLTGQYLANSLSFYRRAADSCAESFEHCEEHGYRRVMICGASDLAEIACLRSAEHAVDVIGVLDPEGEARILDFEPRRAAEAEDADAWLVTDLVDPQATYEGLIAWLPRERVLVPRILGVVRDL